MKPWSRVWRHCRECGTTGRRHDSHGYCTACAERRRYRKERGIPLDLPRYGVYMWRMLEDRA